MPQNDNDIMVNSFVLAPEDSLFCQVTFDTYANHLQFLTELTAHSDKRIREYLNVYKSIEPYDSEFSQTCGTVDTMRITAQKLTESFADKIQVYFRRKYNIDFDFLNLKIGRNFIPPGSYGPLINNIVNQVGNDFHAAGQDQVKKRFQDQYRFQKSQPILKNNIVQFPSYASYNQYSYPKPYICLKSKEFCFNSEFLDAINLFFCSSLRLSEGFTELLAKWRDKIDTDICYTLFKEYSLSLKFFKNRRVDLIFKSDSDALNFFEYYELEGVVARNAANTGNNK